MVYRICFKSLFILLSMLNLSHAIEMNALVRNDNFKAVTSKVKLVDLTSLNSFEGKYFKIVLGKSNDAIRFDHEDEQILLKAATTYYHLNKARTYFVEKLNSKYVKSMKQVVIRLEIKNKFNEIGHFAHDNLEPQFNNALSVPAGEGRPSRGIAPWGAEIWFRPKKIIHLKEIEFKQANMQNFDGVLKSFRQQIHMQTLQRFLLTLVNGTAQTSFGSIESIFRLVGASIFMEGAYHMFDPLARLFQRKKYWLDSAMVPEIIYHEYAHIALSDHLELTHSTPVNEGMADYFAAEISGHKNLATKIKKHNTFSGKKANNKKMYSVEFETTGYANTDFVFGLFWDFREKFNQQFAAKFLFELRENLTTNSNIHAELSKAMFDKCERECAAPFNDRIKLYNMFYSRGL